MDKCAISLFMSLTSGENWRFLSQPLRMISVAYEWLFIFFIVFLQLGVLNIVTSIFITQASVFAKRDAEMMAHEQLKQRESTMMTLEDIFVALDTDGNGTIEMEEFMNW